MIRTAPHNTRCTAKIKPCERKQLESSAECSVQRINMDCRRSIDLLAWDILRPIASLPSTDSYYTVKYMFNGASRWPSGPTCTSCICNIFQDSLICFLFVQWRNKKLHVFCMDSVLKKASKHFLVWSNQHGFKTLASLVNPIDRHFSMYSEKEFSHSQRALIPLLFCLCTKPQRTHLWQRCRNKTPKRSAPLKVRKRRDY